MRFTTSGEGPPVRSSVGAGLSRFASKWIVRCIALSAIGCGGGNSSGGGASAYAGVYAAAYSGTYTVSSPAGVPSGSNTLTGTVTVTAVSSDEVGAAWSIPPNAPSGTLDFALNGATGAAVDLSAPGACFTGVYSDGNTQTNCCTSCSITFSDNSFVQPNSGTFTGVTAAGVAYSGTYSGQWTGTK